MKRRWKRCSDSFNATGALVWVKMLFDFGLYIEAARLRCRMRNPGLYLELKSFNVDAVFVSL